MMNVVPESPSLILQSTHILVVQVESAAEKPWTPRKPSGEERTVSLTLKLEEVAKGRVRNNPGDSIKIDVRQVRFFVDWTPPPGIWSKIPIDAKTRVVIFSQTASDDTTLVLNDPASIKAFPVDEALFDVHLAVQAESKHLDLAGILAQAKTAIASVGELFADYLWYRYQYEAMADIKKFELILRFLEDPALNEAARETLIMIVPDDIETLEPPAVRHVERLAISLFHLLEMPESKGLHDNIIHIYLPNLLDVSNKDALPPSKIFQNFPTWKVKAQQILAAYKGPESTEPLMKWLKR